LFPKQFRIHAVLIVACLFIIIFPMISEKPDAEKTEKAREAAMKFLHQIDHEQFAESWQDAARLMRDKVTQQDWVDTLTKSRALSGELVERTEENASYSTSAKDSPEGEYIMFKFDSQYERAKNVTEYLTVMLEGDRWRVAGYFIK
jgi:membrane-bound lytic murein transglycosylase